MTTLAVPYDTVIGFVPFTIPGVEVRAELVTPATALAIDLAVLKDQYLRVQNGDLEDVAITAFLKTGTALAERWTRRAVRPQTWRMRLSRFPSGDVVLIRPPLVDVVAFTYRGADGVPVTVDPASYTVLPPSRYGFARLSPVTAWPASTLVGPWPVTLELECGYVDDVDPEFLLIQTGIGLVTGELYKQRSTSVQDPNNTPANLGLDYFFRPVY